MTDSCFRIKVVVPKNDFQGCLNCTNTVFVCTRFNTLMDGNIKKWGITQVMQLLCCSLALKWTYNLTSDNTTLRAPSARTPSISWLWWCDRKCCRSIFLLMSGRFSASWFCLHIIFFTCLHRMFWMYSVITCSYKWFYACCYSRSNTVQNAADVYCCLTSLQRQIKISERRLVCVQIDFHNSSKQFCTEVDNHSLWANRSLEH